MISHSAVISEVAGVHAFLKQISYGSTITEDDVVLSYLPLAHIFDRCALSEPRRPHSWSSYEKSCRLREGSLVAASIAMEGHVLPPVGHLRLDETGKVLQ